MKKSNNLQKMLNSFIQDIKNSNTVTQWLLFSQFSMYSGMSLPTSLIVFIGVKTFENTSTNLQDDKEISLSEYIYSLGIKVI